MHHLTPEQTEHVGREALTALQRELTDLAIRQRMAEAMMWSAFRGVYAVTYLVWTNPVPDQREGVLMAIHPQDGTVTLRTEHRGDICVPMTDIVTLLYTRPAWSYGTTPFIPLVSRTWEPSAL